MGILTVLTLAVAVVSAATTAYQVIQAKKQKRKALEAADARKGFEIVSEGEPDWMPIVYGRAKVGGVRTQPRTSHSFAYVAPNSEKTFLTGGRGQSGYTGRARRSSWAGIIGSIAYALETVEEDIVVSSRPSGYMNKPLSGERNEFLMYQQALCVGPINRVIDVIIDNGRYITDPDLGTYGEIQETPTRKKHNGVKAALRMDFHYYGTEADSIAKANHSIFQSAKFRGLAFLTACFKLDRDEPQFSGPPNVQALIEGRLVRTVAGGVLSTTLSYEDDPGNYTYTTSGPFCLLDYMLDKESGAGYDLDEINLASFEAADAVCSQIIQQGVQVGGKIWKPSDGSFFTSTRDLPLYECNIVIDPSKPSRDNIESLLSCMGDARLIYSNGQYHLNVQYPLNNGDIDVVADITDEDILLDEKVEITWPNASNKYNFATVRFNNEFEDFAQDSISWPAKFTSEYLRGIGAQNIPPSQGSWDAGDRGGNYLNNYAVWLGTGNSTNISYKLNVTPETAGSYTFKANGDDSFTVTVRDASNAVVASLSGNYDDDDPYEAPITLSEQVYTITVTATNSDPDERNTFKGVGASIEDGSTVIWSTRDTNYSDFITISDSGNVYNTLLAEDNGVELEANVYNEAITDPYHALAKAEELVRTSRSAAVYKFHMIIRSFYLQPGDFIRFTSEELNIGPIYLRVEGTKLANDGQTCEISCTRFDASQLAWAVKDDVYYSPHPVFSEFVMPQPASLTYSGNLTSTAPNSGKLTAAQVSFSGVAGYVFYAHYYGIDGFDEVGAPVYNEIGRSTTNTFDLPQIDAASAFFGVRAISSEGLLSQMTTTDPLDAVDLVHNWIPSARVTSTALGFSFNGSSYTPANITLTAEVSNFANPVYSWSLNGVEVGTQSTYLVAPFSASTREYVLIVRESNNPTVATSARFTLTTVAGVGNISYLDSIDLGSGFLTGFGGLAGLNGVNFGTNVYLEDGITFATDSALVTSVGTASAIAGQGSLATLNSANWSSQISGIPNNLSGLIGTEPIDNTAQLWSDVGGAGRPDDNADVTSANIASGITGQGAFATLSTADWGSHIANVPTNLAALSGAEDIDNSLITAESLGIVAGAGAGVQLDHIGPNSHLFKPDGSFYRDSGGFAGQGIVMSRETGRSGVLYYEYDFSDAVSQRARIGFLDNAATNDGVTRSNDDFVLYAYVNNNADLITFNWGTAGELGGTSGISRLSPGATSGWFALVFDGARASLYHNGVHIVTELAPVSKQGKDVSIGSWADYQTSDTPGAVIGPISASLTGASNAWADQDGEGIPSPYATAGTRLRTAGHNVASGSSMRNGHQTDTDANNYTISYPIYGSYRVAYKLENLNYNRRMKLVPHNDITNDDNYFRIDTTGSVTIELGGVVVPDLVVAVGDTIELIYDGQEMYAQVSNENGATQSNRVDVGSGLTFMGRWQARYSGANAPDWNFIEMEWGPFTDNAWDSVAGPTRPEDNADVTSNNTAAAIVGQSDLATAPFGLNAASAIDAENIDNFGIGRLDVFWPSEGSADITKALTGPTSINFAFDSDGNIKSGQTGNRGIFSLVRSSDNTVISSGVSWSVSVISGSYSGASPTISGSGSGQLNFGSHASTTGRLRITATLGSLSYTRDVDITKTQDDPPTSNSGGGGGGSTYVTGNASGDTTTAWVTIFEGEVDTATGKNQTVLTANNHSITASGGSEGTCNIQYQWQRESSPGSNVWSNVGAATDSNPDPGTVINEPPFPEPYEGAITCTITDTGLAAETTYSYRLQMRRSSGQSHQVYLFSGPVSMDGR